MMRALLLVAALVVVAHAQGTTITKFNVGGEALGSKEVIQCPTNVMGKLSGKFNTDTLEMDIKVEWDAGSTPFNVTGVHFHQGVAGSNPPANAFKVDIVPDS